MQSSRNKPWLLAVGLVAAVGAGAFLLWRRRRGRAMPQGKATLAKAAVPLKAGATAPVLDLSATQHEMKQVITKVPKTAMDWYTIGRELPFDGIAVIEGVEYTELELFRKAVKLDSTLGSVWNGLGSICPPQGKLEIEGFGELNQCQFYVMALEREPTLARAWMNLMRTETLEFPITISGATYENKMQLALKSLSLSPENAESWRVVANLLLEDPALSAETSVVVNGAPYTVLAAASKAIAMGDKPAWLSVTILLDRLGLDEVEVNGETVTLLDTIKICALLDPFESTNWENLGTYCRRVGLRELELGGTKWSIADFFKQSVALNPRSWKSVYGFLEANSKSLEQVLFENTPYGSYTGMDLAGYAATQAAEPEPSVAACAYFCLLENARLRGLGNVRLIARRLPGLEDVIEDKTLTYTEVFRILEGMVPETSLLWCMIGRFILDGLMYANTYTTMAGDELTALDCLTRGLNIEKTPAAWHFAGLAICDQAKTKDTPVLDITITIDGETYNAAQCFVQALLQNPSASDSWFELATVLQHAKEGHIMYGDRVASRLDCWANSLDLDDDPAAATWINFGLDLPPGHTYQLGRRNITVTRQNCFEIALQMDSDSAEAWHLLGESLTPGSTINVGELKGLDRRACALRAVSSTAQSSLATAVAWSGLAELLEDDSEIVTVKGDPYNRVACLVASLNAQPLKKAWSLLGGFLGPDETVCLSDGTEVDKETCFAKAAEACT